MGIELLIEIGTEEIPARFGPPALEHMASLMKERLKYFRIGYSRIRCMCTPRRLVIHAEDVSQTQDKHVSRVIGPPARIAYDSAGKPTKAAIGFANNAGVMVEELRVEQIQDKGAYLVAEKEDSGVDTFKLLPQIIPQWISGIYFPKTMRWGNGDMRFARPIHWILALFGGEVVPFELDGIRSGGVTYGHRFINPGPIEIKDFDSYLKKLEGAGIICDHERRKEMIMQMAKTEAQRVGGRLREDSALLEEVTHLVEWPVALCGTFENRYLELPEDVLITSMRNHQRYFSLINEGGELLPRFITISNTPVGESSCIIEGNERVLRARLADAAFFLKEDIKKPLGDYTESLKGVVFQEQLGNLYEKAVRLKGLSVFIASELKCPELSKGETDGLITTLQRASMLCKCDLVSEMVGEFPELQGIMGKEYARRSSETEGVAEAIYEHYLPRFAGDILPSTLAGSVLSLANKMDNLAGCFILDLLPTGSEDPHALRRQTQGIIQIMLNQNLVFPFDEFIRKGLSLFFPDTSSNMDEFESKLNDFLMQRFNNYFLAQGYDYDLITAVLGTGDMNPVFMKRRLDALKSFRSTQAFGSILLPFKRVINILPKGDKIERVVDTSLFSENAEMALFERFKEMEDLLKSEIDRAEYLKALEIILELKEPIDLFFDKVLVMHEDAGIRKNRLALLSSIGSVFLRIADFSKIVEG